MELEEEVWRKRTLEQLEQIRIGLSRKRSLEDSVLPWPVKSIRVSSVDAVFSLPKSIDGHSLHLNEVREFFLAHQVLRVLLNGVCILQVCTFISNTTIMLLHEPHYCVFSPTDLYHLLTSLEFTNY